ncbi:RNA polymerase sigma-70 factor, ECF subfamily [Bacillus thuringiensis]|uniref:RNA polymerase sigma-70 factor, ECF subfamily n=1 Tax=Bacillus thuringiensis TaxID=1428 RepID=A0A1C4GKI5_BACTU|nr:hypothetical protein BK743_07750 [Bacillus thuringiensis serovar sylvestriensis]SCC68718.1 RNA polymerase sigma-70 factor, ECF subfamily [Bacillus thuringiensis]
MEEKVEELIDIYKQQIYSLCYKLAKTKEDAEDIFQETWIKVFSSRHQLSCVENYKRWITTICVRTFYDFYVRRKGGKIAYWICFIKRMVEKSISQMK